MANRELIALLKEAQTEALKVYDEDDRDQIAEWVANWLEMNWVTIQKWIPVTERLPLEEDANEEGLVLVRNIGCPQYEAMDWYMVYVFEKGISHWMPLPEPPKGE